MKLGSPRRPTFSQRGLGQQLAQVVLAQSTLKPLAATLM